MNTVFWQTPHALIEAHCNQICVINMLLWRDLYRISYLHHHLECKWIDLFYRNAPRVQCSYLRLMVFLLVDFLFVWTVESSYCCALLTCHHHNLWSPPFFLSLTPLFFLFVGPDPDSRHRRGRHARGDHCAKQLFWLGPVRWRIPAQQQLADHCGCPHWLFWSHPVLHHVRGKFSSLHVCFCSHLFNAVVCGLMWLSELVGWRKHCHKVFKIVVYV